MAQLRKPAVAGSFYPSGEDKLGQTIKDFLKKARLSSDIAAECIKAAIVPHAGYFYSGYTAAFAYKALRKAKNLRHFILLGPSHFSLFSGAAQDTAEYWETPLSKVQVKHLPDKSPLASSCEPHFKEHCLEVQLPFLQVIFEKFAITPIVTSDNCDYRKLAAILKPHLKEHTILIVSSDFSHFYPEPRAETIDRATLKQISKLNDLNLVEGKYEACGKTAILTAIELAKTLKWIPKLLHYETSAAASADYSRVVGYASIVFLGSEK